MKIEQLAKRTVEEVLKEGYSDKKIFKMVCLCQKAETGDISKMTPEDLWSELSQKEAIELINAIFKETERKLENPAISYYEAICLVEILDHLKMVEKLQVDNKKVRLAKKLLSTYINPNTELSLEIGKILDED